MTNREFYTAIINGSMTDEVKTHATEALAKLDERNQKRSSKPSKAQLENEPIKTTIIDYLTAHGGAVAADIAAEVDITTQKASALCRQLVESGRLTVEEVKIPKKGKCKKYSIAPTAEDESDSE